MVFNDLNCTKLSTKFMVLDFTQSIKKIHGQLFMDLEHLEQAPTICAIKFWLLGCISVKMQLKFIELSYFFFGYVPNITFYLYLIYSVQIN